MINICFLIILVLFPLNKENYSTCGRSAFNPVNKIEDIPLPKGFTRVALPDTTFGNWLRRLSFREDKRIFLYNGCLKNDQASHYGVLDKPIGKKNLQQCADVVMRLRAEYLFDEKRYDEIRFRDNANTLYHWKGGADRSRFAIFLDKVFGMCGSASLEKQLQPRKKINEIMPGDVFIEGGFPGHAMIVVDVAINQKQERCYILVQGYMPAQDIHVVLNPLDLSLGPWYRADERKAIITPSWTFKQAHLRSW